MKIGIDARPLSYNLKGIGYYLKYTLDALQLFDRVNHYYLVSNKTINYQLVNDRWKKIEGRLGGRSLSSPWMQFFCFWIAHKYRFNIFWGTRHHLPLMLPLRVKRVVTVHDLVHLEHPATMLKKGLILERLLMKRSLKSADAIVTVSHATASDIRKHYPEIPWRNVRTIYPGVPYLKDQKASCAFVEGLPPNYFLFVGTMEPRKNLSNLLKAFEKMGPEKNDVYLVIVGDRGWKDGPFKMLFDNYKSAARVIFTGYVPRDKMSSIYKRSVCLVYPSLYEGFGFPVLEAMSCGVPVITSNRSSMKEVSGDAALLVDPDNVDAIERAMHRMLTDSNFRKDLISKSLLRLQAFSWDRCAKELTGIFNKVMPG